MPIVYFDNTNVLVSSSGILSTNASISQSNELSPAYVIGKYQAINQVPRGPILSTFSFSYYPIVTKEPNYDILNTIRRLSDDFLYSGTTIEIAGVTGYNCYLSSYELQSAPNGLVKSNVVYDTFTPLSGQITSKTGTSDLYNPFDKIPHGWTTYISSSGNCLIAPTYNFTYKFNADWQPMYIIGQKIPYQVNLMKGTEEMSFVRDSFTHIQFSGEEVTGSFITGDWLLELFNYQLIAAQTAGSGALIFDISGAKIIDSKLVVDVGNFVRSETSIRRYY